MSRASDLLRRRAGLDDMAVGVVGVILLWHWVGAIAVWRQNGGGKAIAIGLSSASLPSMLWWLVASAPVVVAVLAANQTIGSRSQLRRLGYQLAILAVLVGVLTVVSRVVEGAGQPAWSWHFAVLTLLAGAGAFGVSRLAPLLRRVVAQWTSLLIAAVVVIAGEVTVRMDNPAVGRSLAGVAAIPIAFWIGHRFIAGSSGPIKRIQLRSVAFAAAVMGLIALTTTGAYPVALDERTGWAGGTAAVGLAFTVCVAVIVREVMARREGSAGHRSGVRADVRPNELALLRVLAAVRLAAWLWVGLTFALRWNEVRYPGPARLILAATMSISVLLAWGSQAFPDALLSQTAVLTELFGALVVAGADGWLFSLHPEAHDPSFGGVWPIAAVLSAGLVWGPLRGGAAGALIGLSRLTATALGAHQPGITVFGSASSVVSYAIAGAAVGYLSGLLRSAEREVATARVREQLSRQLHDGVLQTLGLVERRSTDPVLAALARHSEQDLRTFLYSTPDRRRTGLGDGLVAAATRFERLYGYRTQVLVPEDLPELPEEIVASLLGAASEALTNAGKHAAARNVAVFAEVTDDGGVLVSVRDDGLGFDTEAATFGQGLRASIQDRIAEVGGRVEISSEKGQGTEVCLWLP